MFCEITCGRNNCFVHIYKFGNCILANLQRWQMWQEIISNKKTKKNKVVDCPFQIQFQSVNFKLNPQILPQHKNMQKLIRLFLGQIRICYFHVLLVFQLQLLLLSLLNSCCQKRMKQNMDISTKIRLQKGKLDCLLKQFCGKCPTFPQMKQTAAFCVITSLKIEKLTSCVANASIIKSASKP